MTPKTQAKPIKAPAKGMTTQKSPRTVDRPKTSGVTAMRRKA